MPEASREWLPRARGFRARMLGAMLVVFLIELAGITAGFLARRERNALFETFSRTWTLSEKIDLLQDQLGNLHRQFALISRSSSGDPSVDPMPEPVRVAIIQNINEAKKHIEAIKAIQYPWMSEPVEQSELLIEDWVYIVRNFSGDFINSLTRLINDASPRAEKLLEINLPALHEQINSQLVEDQRAVADLGNEADRTLVLALIIPMLFFIWIFYLLVRRVLGSLNKIARGINTYAQGDFSHRVEIDGDDEFSDAAGQINMMADQRHQALESLNLLNATLEAKVEARTAELKKSRETLAEAQRIAKVGSWELDLTNNTLTWSEEVFRIFEIDPGKFGASYEAFLDAIHPDDREAVNFAYSNSLVTRTPYLITHRLRMADGRIKHVEERCETEFDGAGKPLASYGTIQDITEKVRAEESIREKNIINRQVINTSLDAVVIIDEDGMIVDWNSQADTIFGWPRGEVIGRTLSDTIVPHKYRDAHKAGMKRFLETGEGPVLNQRLEITALRRDGTEFPIELAISPMKIGDRYAFSAFIRDLTSRKEDEAERARLQSQLTQSQKMEAIGRLAGGVAHDFNNMLSVILGYTDMASAKTAEHEAIANDLKEIKNAAERATGITRQLLAFARKQTVSPRLLDLNTTVTNMLGMLKRLIGEDVQLNWSPTSKPHPVLIDPSQIDQILVNLCVNARDALHKNGQINIETGEALFSESDAEERTDIQPGHYVTLTVSDNGSGMDKETLRVIFEPFFTTKGRGTGLGLATVYGIVRQNKGFITVYSEPGIGTTFSVYLPWAAGKQEATASPFQPTPKAKGAETILVVEDEPAILTMIQHMLESIGYTVLTANLPSVALQLAEKHQGDIQLLLSDVIMPEMNGRELAQKITAKRPALKVLFMSGYTSDFIDKQGVLEEGVFFIQKPFSPADLAAKVRSLF